MSGRAGRVPREPDPIQRAIAESVVVLEPALVDKVDGARFLAVSPRLVDAFVRNGDLVPVRVPGIRRVMFRVDELRALADRWSATRNGSQPKPEAED